MIRRILKKLNFIFLKAKINSFDGASNDEKPVKFSHQLNEQHKKLIQPYYEEYIREISRADMAASLELAAFMFTICKMNKYKKLLDMGSGLSSFIFRLYAKENEEVEVFSIDDDKEWLMKTKGFLSQHELDTKNMMTLDEFIQSNETNFDCILHDLNFVEIRINFVELIVAVARPAGVIVFDDVHKPDYLHALLLKLKGIPNTLLNLKALTLDHYNRYALIMVKK